MPLTAHFANKLSLVGYQSGDVEPGSRHKLYLFWQASEEIERDVKISVQLYDVGRQTLISSDVFWPLNGVFRVRAWHPGDIMPLNFHIKIPDNLAPGPYQLNVGLIDLLAHKPVSLLTGADALPVVSFRVPLPADNRLPENRTAVTFANIIALDDYSLKRRKD